MQSISIELLRLTGAAQDTKRCMAWGAIELIRMTRVVQDAKRFMALGAIEGNRTHPFDLIELARLTWVAQDAKRCIACRLPLECVDLTRMGTTLINRTFTSLEWVQLCCTRVLEYWSE